MVLLPVIERELRVAARRGKTYWLRIAAALVAALVCGWVVWWAETPQPNVQLGRTLFTYLSVLAFAFGLLVGPFITADCLSEEKRDGTLGLLFLTDLSSLHVVLGKWIATSLAGLYGLLAILPALGLPLLFGGVTPGEYGRTALGVTNAIFFSLAGGMFVSVLSREQTKATLGAVALVLGLTGLAPGLYVFLSAVFWGRPLTGTPPLALLSPAYTGLLAQDAAYRAAPHLFWTSFGLVQALAWGFLVGTALLVPRVWREDPGERPVAHRWLYRLGCTRGWRRAFQRRLERNPVLAVAARRRWPHWVFWTLVGLVAVNVYWIAIGSRRVPGAAQFHSNFAHALIFTNRVWITVMACHFFLEARRTGALELLLTTPLPARTLLRGHWRALAGYFAGPILVIGLLHVGYVWGNWMQVSGRPGVMAGPSLLPFYVAAAASSYLNFLTDVLALCAVGGWLSLSLRKPALALLLTFGLVILLPWVVGYYLPAGAAVGGGRFTRWLLSLPWVQQLVPGGLLGFSLDRTVAWVGKNLLFVLWALPRLRRHFRAAAALPGDWRGERKAGRPPATLGPVVAPAAGPSPAGG